VARIFLERGDVGEDLRRLLDRLIDRAGATGEFTPPCDVVERPGTLEITVDIPGVPAEAVTIVFARHALVIAGSKLPAGCGQAEAVFHLAERSFGRFARVLRVNGAVDAGRAHATLEAGELRVTLPRIDERRGGEICIPIRTD
jgi:HSP20 family protein